MMNLHYLSRFARASLASPKENIVRLSLLDTLRRVVDDNVGLARFGDGELKLALYGKGLRFQRHSNKLQEGLNAALLEANPAVLRSFNHIFTARPEWSQVAFYERYPKKADAYRTVHTTNDIAVFHRSRQQREYRRHWRIVANETGVPTYGEATVFYLGFYLEHYANGTIEEVLDLFRALFNGRRILFVGPERPMGGGSFRAQLETMQQMGLRGAQFIAVPETDAFEHSDQMLRQILDSTGFDDVFLQAGPAATAWAFELAGRIQGRVLDVGSLNTQLRYLI